ncbi:uncharacterized protein CIMG_13776 [Coccidioides immitis RS]|uniref:Transcription activator GCR1-like domain-containing protein n=1 Tax=Coccidioides immitis (strain RS) TaxID=246410 RepID=Q1E2H9_COCIM|nr:uncharacterized protein CIMG_13691 [Coccidioides immitis RS]XP_001244741.2 uncharacterized protein CIMG_13776 [Coccidioides immitis RS]EAS32210.3 hypothetical protein CIMG_13691 [Coccidioides immitis RS]EAS33158.3 hypothetical protein CIMG_13776 [Coccidioides immitis RS]
MATPTLNSQSALMVEMEARVRHALDSALDARPKKTRMQYESRQEEWRHFCRTKGFQDGELVTEQKLLWFLSECVVGRPAKRSCHSRDRTNENGEPVVQTLDQSFIKSCCTNSYSHSVGQAVRALLETHSRQEHERKKAEFVDRGAGTLLDGYHEKDIVRLVEYCWQGWSESKKGQSVEPHLRTAVDFLMGHSMLLRGESRRTAQLADLFTLELTNEGPTPCFPMVLIMGNGKTNQMGRIEYATVMRHRNPLLCTMAQTAFYLFYRWDIVREPPPQFHNRQDWYQLHLIKGDDVRKPLSYETQLDWIRRIYSGTGLSGLKKTHAGRAAGARHAEQVGVSEGQIRRAGRWNSDALSQCYLTNIPRKFVRAMAGFDSRTPGNFYLPRARVPVPESLERAVWPWVDDWMRWFESYDAQDPNSCLQGPELRRFSDQSGPWDQPRGPSAVRLDRDDLAAQGFLRLLHHLRTVLLQDSVILQPLFPGHPLWTSPVFMREDYRQFAEAVRVANTHKEEPYEMQLQQTVPMVADQLCIVQQDLGVACGHLHTALETGLQKINNQLEALTSGQVSFLVQAFPAGQRMMTAAAAFEDKDEERDSGSTASREAQAPACSLEIAPASASASVPATYQLSRTITTVPDLWQEWTVGLGGGPSVQSLDALYGAKWRPGGTERMFYSRRKVIIDYINRQRQGSASGSAAVEELELVRQRGKLSLNRLSRMLRVKKKLP